jgi:hypothetical protein
MVVAWGHAYERGVRWRALGPAKAGWCAMVAPLSDSVTCKSSFPRPGRSCRCLRALESTLIAILARPQTRLHVWVGRRTGSATGILRDSEGAGLASTVLSHV